MLLLRGATDLLRVVTGSAADVEPYASVLQANAATPPVVQPVPDFQALASITTATTTTIVDASGLTSGHVYNIKQLSFYNNHASQSTTFRVEVNDGTRTSILWNGVLLAGEKLEFDETGKWTLYDANGNVKAATFPAATQTEMEAATANDKSVTPSNFQWHPGACKMWIKATPGGTINASHNVTSEADATAGVCDITIATDFSSAHYVFLGLSFRANTNTTVTDAKNSAGRSGTMAAGTVSLETYDQTATNFAIEDPAFWCAAAFGDQ